MIITLDAFVNPHDRISVTPTHENVGAHFTCHAIALAKADVRPQRTGINPPEADKPRPYEGIFTAKSPKTPFSVIPVKTGIQEIQELLDSRLRGSDAYGDFLQTHHI